MTSLLSSTRIPSSHRRFVYDSIPAVTHDDCLDYCLGDDDSPADAGMDLNTDLTDAGPTDAPLTAEGDADPSPSGSGTRTPADAASATDSTASESADFAPEASDTHAADTHPADTHPAESDSAEPDAAEPDAPASEAAEHDPRLVSTADYHAIMGEVLPRVAEAGPALSVEERAEIAERMGVPAEVELLRDPKALYEEALRYATAQLWPIRGELDAAQLARAIPADAVRLVAKATWRRFAAAPDAVRLLIADNLFRCEQRSQDAAVFEDSPVVLELDRVLMRGHDVGAFRSGVSAEDVYVVLLSLSSFAIAHGPAFFAIYGMNPLDDRNAKGMEELAADAVLALLTSTMPTTQGTSYTHSSSASRSGSSVAAALYDAEFSDASELSSTYGNDLVYDDADDEDAPLRTEAGELQEAEESEEDDGHIEFDPGYRLYEF